jgi:hypothetical protein
MSRSLVKLLAGIAHTGARLLGAVKGIWASTMARPPAKYRPEAHYMRGPGPKWRAKRAPISTQTVAPQ